MDWCKGQTRTGTLAIEVTDDMSHTSLVAHEGSQVDGFFGVILVEAFRGQMGNWRLYKPSGRT